MAIAHDSSAIANTVGAQTSLTFSHTCTGSNLILFVTVSNNSGSDTVSGITYAGAAMTKITSTNGAYGWNSMWYLIAPATGANNVIVSSSSASLAAASASYTGAQQSGQPDASTGNAGSQPYSSLTTALVTSADNAWVVSGLGSNSTPTGPTAGTGTTLRRAQAGGSGVTVAIGDSNGVVHPAGSYSMTWTLDANSAAAMIQASIVPAAATTTSTSTSTSTSTTSTSTSTSTTSTSTSTTSTSSSTSTSTTTTLYAGCDNLAIDPSFDKVGGSWTISNNGSGATVTYPSTEQAFEGTHSGKMATLGAPNSSFFNQNIKVNRNVQYVFSVYCYVLSLVSSGPLIRIKSTDLVATLASSSTDNTLGSWVRLSCTYTVPATGIANGLNDTIRFILDTPPTAATYYFDAAMMEVGSTPGVFCPVTSTSTSSSTSTTSTSSSSSSSTSSSTSTSTTTTLPYPFSIDSPTLTQMNMIVDHGDEQ